MTQTGIMILRWLRESQQPHSSKFSLGYSAGYLAAAMLPEWERYYLSIVCSRIIEGKPV